MKTTESVNKAKPTVDIIVVTYNNTESLRACLMSLALYTQEPFRLILVNNGTPESLPPIPNLPGMVVLNCASNGGWMGGVNTGLKYVMQNNPAPFICWMNDDVQILDHDYGWLTKMLHCFQLGKIGAVGPTSNAVMGVQSCSYIGLPPAVEATRLSGMCCLVRREVVQEVGLLDEALPGGDDLDYSIRIRSRGYKLCICRRTFMLHHYATTGRRVHGDYWDSKDHTEAINMALIKKHGLKAWFVTRNDLIPKKDGERGYDFSGAEEAMVLERLKPYLDGAVYGELGRVLDLGCGGKKIHPNAIGVDIRSNGDLGVGANSATPSAADVSCDVSKLTEFYDQSVDCIVAKHLLEHVLDIPKTLREWRRVLKEDGELIIVSPDYRFCEAISCDPSHVHALTPDSVRSWLEALGGWTVTETFDVRPGYVFGVVARKVKVREAVAV